MRGRRGVAAVEFALTVPVILILGLGMVEWGWVFNREIAAVQAVRDGALAGSCVRTTGDPVSVARNRVLDALAAQGVANGQATVTATVTTGATGRLITVHMSMPYRSLIEIVPAPTTVQWSATLAMVDR